MKKLLSALLLYALCLLRHGYEYGRSDQIEILPYAFKIAGIQDFKGDFFTDNISQVIPNERFVTALFLSVFGNGQEIAAFVLHIILHVLLILALLKIADYFLKNHWLSAMAILLTQIVFFYWNLGGNELYGNDLQGGTFADCFAAWAMVFFLEKKYIISFSLITLGIGFQAIVALQVGLLMAAVLGITELEKILKGNFRLDKSFFELVVAMLIFVIIGLGYIFGIKKASDGMPISAEDSQAIFDITFRFRNPHHFMPSAFLLKGWLLMPICAVASLYFFRQNKEMIRIFLLAGLGILLYTIGVEILESRTIAAFQAYKMTIWLKFLGMIAILGILQPFFAEKMRAFSFPEKKQHLLIISSIIGIFLIIYFFQKQIPYIVNFDFKSYKARGEEVLLCQKIQETCPKEAVFITPFSFTEVPIYAKRATFISYKANMRHAPAIFEWAKRLEMLYGLDYKNKKWDTENAPLFYENLSNGTLAYLKSNGVNYAIFKNKKAHLQEVTSTDNYFVYKL